MNLEMNAPLLRPSTPTSTHTTSSTSSTNHSFKSSHSRPLSTYTTLFSHSKSPSLSSQSSGSSLKTSSTLSRTRSLYTKFNTEVQFMKLKLSTRRRKDKGKEGRWVKIEGEEEGERRIEMVWRRMDGGQGMIPYGGVGRERLD
ncbi:predicted protein [Sclerotinia sclerotiorum 1980 UF-70]|uniref:Uncharacterized protein n=2 Tax=Sclerotinia sclerotiorum (strain ATCC 18683 / 1980 / Ss-1) TaxID=665079 RepID=A7F505_SCLS1|nr:predicted protein [Sclerotinia sclerotiorum 1980 UF-70]APA06596.1 hypothetical protein sscle_02g013660 [Sclerotinia sclerotiorum 1980 UF-70]EDN97826.1 predicted protein [Sclerotinia sclerotiorum 1980 UF-70]